MRGAVDSGKPMPMLLRDSFPNRLGSIIQPCMISIIIWNITAMFEIITAPMIQRVHWVIF